MGILLRAGALLALTMALAGCNSTGSRIRQHQELFDSYPPQVRQNLRNGAIEPGYTPEMVLIALGEPDRKVDMARGEVAAQVWTWWRSSPGVGISLGGWNSLGSHVGLGTGVTFGERSRREQAAVVEFRAGRVHGFEVPAPD